MSDHSDILQFLKEESHELLPVRPSAGDEIIRKCLPADLSGHLDAKETLALVRTWLQALEDAATGESKETLEVVGEFVEEARSREETGGRMTCDGALTLFLAGLIAGPEAAKHLDYVLRKIKTQMRHKHIREAVQAEMQSGEHKNVTSARNAVAERMGVTLKTVQNVSKNI